MKRRTFFQSAAIAASSPRVLPAQSRTAGAGYAERDISPALGMEQPSGYGKLYHTSFHDPCKARAAVFNDGQERVALVGLDVGMIPQYVVEQCRAEIEQRCGIKPSNVLLGASHSHSGGPVGGVRPGEYDRASEFIRKLAYEHTINDNPEYVAQLRRSVVDAVVSADASQSDHLCGAGIGEERDVAFNRRFRMKNGQSWTHPGQGNPDVIEPAGPIDPIVSVIGSWDRAGRLVGCVVNYCCHATTNPGGISANWVYYLEQAIRGAFGHHVVVVFLQGTAGDVTQVDNRSPHKFATGDAQARLVGGCVGAEAVRVLLSMHRGALTPVVAATRVLSIPRRAPSAAKVGRAMELVKRDPKEVGVTEWTFAKETVLLDAKVKWSPAVDVEVQAIQVGPVVLMANPAELFVEFGLEMRKRSRFPITMPVAYANGMLGYVPTAEAFSPRGGGYETRLTSYSNLVPSAGGQITDACVRLAEKFTAGAVPVPPPAPKATTPWSYGNVPPELS